MNAVNLSIPAILTNAWRKIDGSKSALWGTNVTILVITLAVIFLLIVIMSTLFIGADQSQLATIIEKVMNVVSIVMPFVISGLIAPFMAGLMMIAIHRARNEPIDYSQGYAYISQWLPTAVALIAITLITQVIQQTLIYSQIHFFAFVFHPLLLIGISLLLSSLVYSFFLYSLPLIVEHELTGWQGLVQSYKLVKPAWFKVFILFLICMALMTATFIPAVVGILLNHRIFILIGIAISVAVSIWILPFAILIMGETYIHLAPQDEMSLEARQQN